LILPCCPFGRLSGGVDLGVGAKRRLAKPNASRGGRSEADRRRCPQIDPGTKEPRAQARGRTPGQSLLVTFWRLKKSLAVRAKPPSAPPAATDMPPTPKNMVGPKAAKPQSPTQFPTPKPDKSSLPPSHTQLPSTQRPKKTQKPPQVQPQTTRHTTNRTKPKPRKKPKQQENPHG